MTSIRARLLTSFGVLLLVPLTLVNLLFAYSSLTQNRDQILRQLSSVASLKEDAIVSWEKQLSRSVVATRIRERLDAAGVVPSSRSLAKEATVEGLFEELFFVDGSGRVIASSQAGNQGKLLTDKDYFPGLFTHGYVSPPFYDLTRGTAQVVAAAPVVGADGRTRGSLVGRANLGVLDRVMAERTGLGNTGTTYLVGENRALVTPSPDGGRGTPVASAGVNAVIASEGTLESQYLSAGGVPWVATFRWVDSLKVVLVAEQQQSEAYGRSFATLAVNLGIEALVLFIALFGVVFVTRSLVDPLDRLTQTALAISGGDLDRKAREDGPRETSLVGQAFNAMTARLRGSIAELTAYKESLEAEVAKRTADLVVAVNRAEESDRLKSAFLATMSHELRTPLNSIIGFTGILGQGLVGPLNDEQKKQLGFVMTSARHLLDLISDVLDISKIEAGQFQVETVEFDLGNVVAKAVKSVEPLAEKKGLSLTVESPALPAPWTGDPRRVEQVLLNLLSNAVKFTGVGGVTVRCRPEGAGVRIDVIDTGPGIPPGQVHRLFKPFQQLDSGLNRQHQGTGLGLSICKRLLELMGGTIEVRSRPGEGSTFSFTLPQAPRRKP